MVTKGKIRPIRVHVIISHIDFGVHKTASGIVIQSDNGKSRGVSPTLRLPRWSLNPVSDAVSLEALGFLCITHSQEPI
jgi:hypothetical protein